MRTLSVLALLLAGCDTLDRAGAIGFVTGLGVASMLIGAALLIARPRARPFAVLLLALSATACTPAQRDAARRDAAAFGKCAAVKIGPSLAGALLGLIGGAPADSNQWGAWGRGLAGQFGRGAVECGAELLASAPGADAVLVESAGMAVEQRAIGFRPAMTAGPAGPSSGAASVGRASSTSDPRAAARWLATHPDAW
jgi:hypothetical protein